MQRIAPFMFVPLALLAAACGSSDDAAGPDGVSPQEAEALEDAAEMIEARRLPDEALPETFEADAPVELAPDAPPGAAPATPSEPQDE